MADPTPAPASDDLVGLLDQLTDIAAPPPVSMLPATPAWGVLGLLLLAVLAFGARAWVRRRRANAYRRAALAELEALAPAVSGGDAAALARLDAVLRRTALAAFPRDRVAALAGRDWTDFLDSTGGAFGPHAGAMLAAPYAARPPAFDGSAVVAAARAWIRRHHA